MIFVATFCSLSYLYLFSRISPLIQWRINCIPIWFFCYILFIIIFISIQQNFPLNQHRNDENGLQISSWSRTLFFHLVLLMQQTLQSADVLLVVRAVTAVSCVSVEWQPQTASQNGRILSIDLRGCSFDWDSGEISCKCLCPCCIGPLLSASERPPDSFCCVSARVRRSSAKPSRAHGKDPHQEQEVSPQTLRRQH